MVSILDRSQALPRRRVVSNPHAVAGSRRAVGYVLLNALLHGLQAAAAEDVLGTVDVVILATIMAANLHRSTKEQLVHGVSSGNDDRSIMEFPALSQSGVARATGIARETVRRHVRKLVDRGLVLESPDGMRAVAIGQVARIGPLVDDLMAVFVQAANRLGDLDAFAVVPQPS